MRDGHSEARHDAGDAREHGTVAYGSANTLHNTSAGQLAHLSDLDDVGFAEGQPDIRGWNVKADDDRDIGKVNDLLVDTGTMQVRYAEVELNDDVAADRARAEGGTDPRIEPPSFVLVPIGLARLDDEHDDVRLDGRATQIAGIPAYQRGGVSRDYESRVLSGYGRGERAADDRFYDDAAFDGSRFLGTASIQGDWNTERSWWEQNYRSRPYTRDDRGFDSYEPGYRYGYESATRHRGRSWNDVEGDLRGGWDRYEHRGTSRSTWEEIKDSVKDAWDHVTGGDHARHAR